MKDTALNTAWGGAMKFSRSNISGGCAIQPSIPSIPAVRMERDGRKSMVIVAPRNARSQPASLHAPHASAPGRHPRVALQAVVCGAWKGRAQLTPPSTRRAGFGQPGTFSGE